MNAERLSLVWKLLNAHRDRDMPRSPAELIRRCAENGLTLGADELWTICTKFAGTNGGEGLCPPSVATFVAELVSDRKHGTVLDPFVGYGALLAPVVAATSAKRVVASHPNPEVLEAAEGLLPGVPAEFTVGDIRGEYLDRTEAVDVIVSSLPFNLHRQTFVVRGVEMTDYRGNELLVRAAVQLRPGGIGVFIVPLAFLHAKRGVSTYLDQLGLHIDAWFHVPGGTFAPLTNIETAIVVLGTGPQPEKIFVAEFTGDDEARASLIARYRKRAIAPAPADGVLVDLQSFRGLPQMVAKRRLEDMTKRMRLPRVRLDEIALSIRPCPRNRADASTAENAFFLPLALAAKTRLSAEELPVRTEGFAHVVLDPDKATARVVAGFFDSPLGREARSAAAPGSSSAPVPFTEVGALPLWIPDAATQDAIVRLDQRMEAVTSQVRELRDELWRRLDANALEGQLEAVNREDTLTDWLESLPFPLASILWTYHTLKHDPIKQYLRLDHFFEGLVEFLAVLVLSASRGDRAFFDAQWRATRQSLQKSRLSLERATFGTWMAIFESFAKAIRSAMSDADARAHWCRVFAIDDPELLEAIVSRDMVSILKNTNALRNSCRGHGGAFGDAEARSRGTRLLVHLNEFRALVGRKWRDYPLVIPRTFSFSEGTYSTSVEVLSGARYPFAQEEVKLRQPLESGELHMVSRRAQVATRLLPFVRVGSSPREERNACYFFNRVGEGNAVRYVSYHFEDRPEVERPDDGALKVIAELAEL